ncbi:hypothetical protein BBK36DRAFT_21310 [Trichoderma citrinoviride]|uniref:Uncharacterized protein n=1 Tax=Trichoderma citrinoviride TaxID=58853 RepID=A0A2T4B5R5_9HYPO|nr:hypothetical protein BBK36DRAFT_21310 [Trichoderma citrinoviride]PTB64551.1 hypothetical protein BBK36DRAFT_21310 [Trichoderma citrinoviride]
MPQRLPYSKHQKTTIPHHSNTTLNLPFIYIDLLEASPHPLHTLLLTPPSVPHSPQKHLPLPLVHPPQPKPPPPLIPPQSHSGHEQSENAAKFSQHCANASSLSKRSPSQLPVVRLKTPPPLVYMQHACVYSETGLPTRFQHLHASAADIREMTARMTERSFILWVLPAGE